MIASGWGRTRDGDNNSIPEILQTVILAMVPYRDCANKWRGLPANVCCASLPGKDTCQGDSGGPLAQNVDGQLVQVGIVSFGAECASEFLPGIYTTVAKYNGWITENKPRM